MLHTKLLLQIFSRFRMPHYKEFRQWLPEVIAEMVDIWRSCNYDTDLHRHTITYIYKYLAFFSTFNNYDGASYNELRIIFSNEVRSEKQELLLKLLGSMLSILKKLAGTESRTCTDDPRLEKKFLVLTILQQNSGYIILYTNDEL